jgi:hypothetical protein
MSPVWKKTTQQQTTPGLRDVPFSSPVPTTREQLPKPLIRCGLAAETWLVPVSDTRTVTVGNVARWAAQAAPVMAPSESDSFLEASSTKNVGETSLCDSFAWLCFFLFNQVYSFSFFHFNHCCGSEIRCFFDPWDPISVIRNEKNPDPGKITRIISESLVTIFWVENA